MSKPINCPACGARMTLEAIYRYIDDDNEPDGPVAHYRCRCGLRGPTVSGVTFRGAAIKAGRAMQTICRAVEVRIAKARIDGMISGKRTGVINMARMCYWLLLDSRKTRRQITERVRREAVL